MNTTDCCDFLKLQLPDLSILIRDEESIKKNSLLLL